MKIIVNKPLNNTNNIVNIKIIEINSADFNTNDITYLIYNYQVPLIKFTDTGEVFNIKDLKNKLNQSVSEVALTLTEDDLESISGSGGSQNLQQTLESGSNGAVNTEIFIQSTGLAGATSSINMIPGGTAPNANGMYLYTDNLVSLTGAGFQITSTSGQGNILSDGLSNTLVITSNSGKLILRGGGQGIDIDGQGGPVNIDSFYGVTINNRNAITAINGLESDEFGEIELSPISGTFANPTSITVVNGIITVIS